MATKLWRDLEINGQRYLVQCSITTTKANKRFIF
ncbi:hypothetical protein QF014_002521 [Pantoea agglomerans]|nr:hypothetical protein [Pantoea agglomerans]